MRSTDSRIRTNAGPSLSSESILRKSLNREASGSGISWNYNAQTFQSLMGSTKVKEEVFDQNELDAVYLEELGFDKSGVIEHYVDEPTCSRRFSSKWDILIRKKKEKMYSKRKRRLAEEKDEHDLNKTGASEGSGRRNSFDSSGFSHDSYEDTTDEDVRKHVSEKSSKKILRRALEAFSSFGADNQDPEAVANDSQTSKPMQRRASMGGSIGSILCKIMSIKTDSKSTSQDNVIQKQAAKDQASDKEVANNSHQSKSVQCPLKRRESLLGIVISFTSKSTLNKTSSEHSGQTEDSDFSQVDKTCSEKMPSQAKKRRSLKEMIKYMASLATGDEDTEEYDQLGILDNSHRLSSNQHQRNYRRATQESPENNMSQSNQRWRNHRRATQESMISSMSHWSKSSDRRTRSHRRATQESLECSVKVFDKLAAEKHRNASVASSFRSEEFRVKLGGEESYNEKICSIIYPIKSK